MIFSYSKLFLFLSFTIICFFNNWSFLGLNCKKSTSWIFFSLKNQTMRNYNIYYYIYAYFVHINKRWIFMIYFTQCNIGRVAKLASTAIYRGCGTGTGLTSCYCQGIIKETSLLHVHFSRFTIIRTCFLQIFFLIFW